MADDLEQELPPTTKATSPLAQVSSTANAPKANKPGALPSVQDVLAKQVGSLEEARTNKKAILDKAIENLQGRIDAQKGPAAEDYFKLTQALLSPTKTGGFAETLGNVSGVGADILGKRKESQASLQDLMDKYRLQGADVDADYLGQTASAVKSLAGTSGSKSLYGKQAEDEGLSPGTPEYVTRVQELSQTKAPTADDSFDKKTGNFITSTGTVIPKAEVTKDREERGKLLDAKARFKEITKDTIKQANSIFNVTGSGLTGEIGKGFAGTFAPDTLSAQTKVFTQAVEGIQKALPPGPASDKDVQQAKATFPGFSSKKALRDWLKSLEDMVDSHITRQDQKYGSEKWYGAGGTPKPKAERNDLGETTDEQKRLNGAKSPPAAPASTAAPVAAPSASAAKPAVPKVGATLHGHRFKGGDPSQQENWEKI